MNFGGIHIGKSETLWNHWKWRHSEVPKNRFSWCFIRRHRGDVQESWAPGTADTTWISLIAGMPRKFWRDLHCWDDSGWPMTARASHLVNGLLHLLVIIHEYPHGWWWDYRRDIYIYMDYKPRIRFVGPAHPSRWRHELYHYLHLAIFMGK